MHEERVRSCRPSYYTITRLLVRGIQMGDMPKLGWLAGFARHAMLLGTLHSHYLLFQVEHLHLIVALFVNMFG